MTRRHYLAVVAGSATLLAAFPLTSVFAQFSWFFFTFIAVILIVVFMPEGLVPGVARLSRAAWRRISGVKKPVPAVERKS